MSGGSTTHPTSTQPTSTKPTSTQPTFTQPTSTQPTSTQPTSTQPTSTQPTSTHPPSSHAPLTSSAPTTIPSTHPTSHPTSQPPNLLSTSPTHSSSSTHYQLVNTNSICFEGEMMLVMAAFFISFEIIISFATLIAIVWFVRIAIKRSAAM